MEITIFSLAFFVATLFVIAFPVVIASVPSLLRVEL
jgi:hypothetical protein